MRKLIIAATAAVGILLAGCQTMEGLGQDLKKGADHVSTAIGKAGDKLTETAREAQEYPMRRFMQIGIALVFAAFLLWVGVTVWGLLHRSGVL